MICDRLKIKPKELCYYPDKIRRKLEEEYYEGIEIEQEIIQQIKELLNNYNFIKQKKLIDLIKLEWMN